MTRLADKLKTEWQDTANFVLGIWLAASPWILSFSADQTPTANAVVVGLIIAATAAGALYAFHAWEEWLNVVLAAWLVVSPWVLGFNSQWVPTWNHVIVGVLAGLLALWSANVAHGTSEHSAGR